MRPVLVGAAVLMVLLVIYWAGLFVGQRALLFPAPSLAGAAARPGDAEAVWLKIAGGSVEAWYLPPLVGARGPAPLLLFTHGNGELIDYWPGAFEERVDGAWPFSWWSTPVTAARAERRPKAR